MTGRGCPMHNVSTCLRVHALGHGRAPGGQRHGHMHCGREGGRGGVAIRPASPPECTSLCLASPDQHRSPAQHPFQSHWGGGGDSRSAPPGEVHHLSTGHLVGQWPNQVPDTRSP